MLEHSKTHVCLCVCCKERGEVWNIVTDEGLQLIMFPILPAYLIAKESSQKRDNLLNSLYATELWYLQDVVIETTNILLFKMQLNKTIN